MLDSVLTPSYNVSKVNGNTAKVNEMSAFQTLNRKQAFDEAIRISGYVASYRAKNGYCHYAARTYGEANNWINFNRDYMYPGTDQIEKPIT